MRLTEAHARLRETMTPWFTTSDAAQWLEVPNAAASTILRRLRETRHVVMLARGRWVDPERMTVDALPVALTAPDPAYISLYSALYRHGMIEQVPDVTYALTLAPTRRVETPLGSVSLHQVAPLYFGDSEEVAPFVRVATPEQALVDTLYLRQARSGLFRALPELTLPRRFSRMKLRRAIGRIRSTSRRSYVEAQLELELARLA